MLHETPIVIAHVTTVYYTQTYCCCLIVSKLTPCIPLVDTTGVYLIGPRYHKIFSAINGFQNTIQLPD